MKKSYILPIILGIIILGIAIGVYAYIKNDQKKVVGEKNQNEIEMVSKKIDDECTEEWNELNDEEREDILITNSSEEKISPNCLINLKVYYKKCGHITNEYIDIPKELINKTKTELQKKYSDWDIEKFSNTEIVLYKENDGECKEHYILREDNGKVTVYRINENGEEVIYEKTDISIDYLTDTDKINIKNGIKVNGNQELNQLIEDFE